VLSQKLRTPNTTKVEQSLLLFFLKNSSFNQIYLCAIDENKKMTFFDSSPLITDACTQVLKYTLPKHNKIESDVKFYLAEISARNSDDNTNSSNSISDSKDDSENIIPIQIEASVLKQVVEILNQFDKNKKWNYKKIIENAKSRAERIIPKTKRVNIDLFLFLLEKMRRRKTNYRR